MSLYVEKGRHIIDQETRGVISARYKEITRAVNRSFWNSGSDTEHSIYVGSYGRGTAIKTSDLDIIVELPDHEYSRFTNINGNGPSRLLQAVKNAILIRYPRTNIRGDGQVVVVDFTDGIRFEVLPAFRKITFAWAAWDGSYIYPDTHMGGNWLSTNPKAEQEAMRNKNSYYETNGLLFDTCKHIRFLHDEFFSSYHLSGIIIDSFVYGSIHNWRWLRENDEASGHQSGAYEQHLLDSYNTLSWYSLSEPPILFAPGSNMRVETNDDWKVLGKVLGKMVT